MDKEKCLSTIDKLTGLSTEEKKSFIDMCNKNISIAELFRNEIPTIGTCTLNDAEEYIGEEEAQMRKHTGKDYNMDNISVAEHVYNEEHAEPEHAHILYTPVPGNVKFFEEWLEGHHPSLGCMFGMPSQVPPDEYYAQLAKAREEAREYR